MDKIIAKMVYFQDLQNHDDRRSSTDSLDSPCKGLCLLFQPGPADVCAAQSHVAADIMNLKI